MTLRYPRTSYLKHGIQANERRGCMGVGEPAFSPIHPYTHTPIPLCRSNIISVFKETAIGCPVTGRGTRGKEPAGPGANREAPRGAAGGVPGAARLPLPVNEPMKTVLVIDDHPQIRRLIQVNLAKLK